MDGDQVNVGPAQGLHRSRIACRDHIGHFAAGPLKRAGNDAPRRSRCR